jgi:putative ABC transport system permease protein
MRASLVLKFALRDWRAGELRLLVAAVVLAVGTVTGISLFVDRLSGALLSESATYLAADRVVASTQAAPEAFVDAATRLGLDTARTMTFPSMVFADDRHALVSVKAVSPGYPLRGELRTAAMPFEAGVVTHGLPPPGAVWLDTLTVGVAELRVDAVLAAEPDRGGSFVDFGPRLLMHIDDVPRTEVVRPGSRIFYRLLIAGPSEALSALHKLVKPQLGPGFRWMSIRQASPSIGSALERAEGFLLLGGLLAVLLAGVAVALGAHRYARRHYDHVAIFKTLGATPRQIQWGYLGLLGLIGAIATAAGLLLGAALHLAILAALGTYVPVQLPWPSAKPVLVGAVSGFVCLAAFALPPVLALRSISPMRVIRRDLAHAGVSRWLTYGCAGFGSVGLLIWYTDDWRLTLWTLIGVVGVSAVFGAIAVVLLRAGRTLGMQAGSGWRLALAGLARRRDENVAQILIFGLAIMLLLILILLRGALLNEWRTQMPEHAPNHFLMNVAAEQVQPLQDLVRGRVEQMDELYPMTRGRVVAVNGVGSKEWQASRQESDRSEPSLDSERNLSWTATLPANNRIEAGAWWPPDGGEPAVSLEEQYASAAGVTIGDVLDFDIGGLPVRARVTSIRRVEWNSMAPNFFILFSPGALQDVAATYMSSFYLAPENKRFLNELLAAFPTVTVIEVDQVIAQIQSIMGRVTQAVELVLGLVLVAGCLVLVASIQASGDERLREHALLRALGASRRLIRASLGAEFALLGAFAGTLAALGAEVTVFALDKQVFELPARLHPWVWLAGPALGAAVVSGVGLFGTRALVGSPPMLVLRELG